MFRQLFDPESCTYTYLIADLDSSQALIIDPVITNTEEYVSLLAEFGLTLKYSVETHVHADHITGGGALRDALSCQTAVSTGCGSKSANIHINDGDIFELSATEIVKAISTPGHTAGSMSFLWNDRVFTGDSLLINGCGRTDFQGGSAEVLYNSITEKLFTLPDDTIVYPGHDYNGKFISSIQQEKKSNSRLANKTREEFIEIMNNLNLPKPKLIDKAVPANIYCGTKTEISDQQD